MLLIPELKLWKPKSLPEFSSFHCECFRFFLISMKASVRPRLDPKGADSSALLYWALLIPIDNLGGKWKMVTWVLCHSLPPPQKLMRRVSCFRDSPKIQLKIQAKIKLFKKN